jgi:hypothetical protein
MGLLDNLAHYADVAARIALPNSYGAYQNGQEKIREFNEEQSRRDAETELMFKTHKDFLEQQAKQNDINAQATAYQHAQDNAQAVRTGASDPGTGQQNLDAIAQKAGSFIAAMPPPPRSADLPGGLINRTGAPVGNVPSIQQPPGSALPSVTQQIAQKQTPGAVQPPVPPPPTPPQPLGPDGMANNTPNVLQAPPPTPALPPGPALMSTLLNGPSGQPRTPPNPVAQPPAPTSQQQLAALIAGRVGDTPGLPDAGAVPGTQTQRPVYDGNGARVVPLAEARDRDYTKYDIGGHPVYGLKYDGTPGGQVQILKDLLGNGTRQLTDPEMANKLRLPVGSMLTQQMYEKGVELVNKTLPQEEAFRKEYMAAHPTATMEDEAKAYAADSQRPQKPPVVNITTQTNQLDRETDKATAPLQKRLDATSAQFEKITDAKNWVNGSAEAQALSIPKVLAAVVSGQGSGVRITQPELNAIGHARGIAGDVEATIQKWGNGKPLTAEQVTQLNGVLDDVRARLIQKQTLTNNAMDEIKSAKSRDEVIAAESKHRKLYSQFEDGLGAPAAKQAQGGYVIGHRYGNLIYQGGDPKTQNSWTPVAK